MSAAVGTDRGARALFELSMYASQDPELAAYPDRSSSCCVAPRAGSRSPRPCPALPRFFDRLYDQRWSRRMDPVEFEADYKDVIFREILDTLGRALDPPGAGCSTSAPMPDASSRSRHEPGWAAEGLELNPQTAAYAARRTGASIRQLTCTMSTRARRRSTRSPSPMFSSTFRIRSLCSLAWRRCLHRRLDGGEGALRPGQLRKEQWRGRLVPGYRPTLADNLVHVNHFSPRVAPHRPRTRRLSRRGHHARGTGTPCRKGMARHPVSIEPAGLYRVARILPGGVDLPVTLNLQAYARRAMNTPASPSSFRRSTTSTSCAGASMAGGSTAATTWSSSSSRTAATMPPPSYLDEVARQAWGQRQLRWVHEDNSHELRCTNRGMAPARGTLVMAWQDDMFLRASWLVPELFATFAAYADIGLVSLSRGLNCVPVPNRSTRGNSSSTGGACRARSVPRRVTGGGCRKWTS